MPRVLIVEETAELLKLLAEHLERMGYEVEAVTDGAQALAELAGGAFDVVVTDLTLPQGVDGLEIVRHVREASPSVGIIVITAFGSVASAVTAMRAGANDLLEKPFSLRDLEASLARILSPRAREDDVAKGPGSGGSRDHQSAAPEVLGTSAAIRRVMHTVDKVANNNLPVLLQGESGTGKEMVARQIHERGPRRMRAFVALNCAALSPSLLESELFGHEKGAFTGASFLKRGKFELAHGGTLFLDEVGDVSLAMQVKLLRFLQEHEFDRVGGMRTIKVDVRIIAATNVDLAKLIATGRFREDLYYRVNVIPITLPPLRERMDDVVLLTQAFARKYGKIAGKTVQIAPDAMEALLGFWWPGNVRQLENTIERAVVLADGNEIRRADLPREIVDGGGPSEGAEPAAAQRESREMATHDDGEDEVRESPLPPGAGLSEKVEAFERGMIFEALKRSGWNQSRASLELKLKRSSLQYKMQKYGLLK